MLGLLLPWAHLHNSHAKVPPPANARRVSFTDSNGNQFTVFIAGEMVIGTNAVVTNLNFKVAPPKAK